MKQQFKNAKNIRYFYVIIGAFIGLMLSLSEIFLSRYILGIQESETFESLNMLKVIFFTSVSGIVFNKIYFIFIEQRSEKKSHSLYSQLNILLRKFSSLLVASMVFVPMVWLLVIQIKKLSPGLKSLYQIHASYPQLFIVDLFPLFFLAITFIIINVFNKYPNIGSGKVNQKVGVTVSIISILFSFAVLMFIWFVECSFARVPVSFYGLKIIHEKNELFYIIDAIPLLFTGFMLVSTLYINNYINILSHKIVNQLNSFNKVSHFAKKIGSGQFDVNYELENENDSFGKSLIAMRDNLQQSAKEEKERQWIFEGIAEIGDLIRNNDSLYNANIAVLEYIVKRVNACQGRIYIVEGDSKQMRIKANAAYAYGRIKETDHLEFKFGEGQVGECCFEKAIIYRTEIPENYPFIPSGLRDEPPFKAIITSPLISNEIIYGVIELVSHETQSELTLKFIDELTRLLGQTIFNLQVNDKTKQLLNEIKNSQNRLQSLLENASELINIYEIDGTIRYVSPSVKNILFFNPEELVGKKEIQYIDKKGQKDYQHLFDLLISNPENEVKKTFEYIRKDQEKIWVEAVGKNLIDDPAIQGIIINMRDITMKIRAEQEEKKRGQMQALSENSPDLIMRINMMGDFFYINPSIQKYSNNTPQSFLFQNLYSVEMSKTFVDKLITILNNVFTTGLTEVAEAAYTKDDGTIAYLDVKGIPEFDANGKIETILYVCHDITEAKNVQQELEGKNKKITESINYAWRIQNAIVPDDNIIKKHLHDSFILYKPKDVVSGDFPWFYHKQNFTYIAAVDCTGHGVPGAMMSLIGYFHLNEINGHQECLSTGEILDKLHQNVRRTLRQDAEGAEARDGMDVALCRIDHNSLTLQFSGAHRPLYMVRNGEINEFKGTRKAIGGITIRRDNPFDIHEIKIEKGDSFYFFSDGLPDQLGGEEGLKFSPARIRQLVVENHGKPASEIKNTIQENFIAYMGNRKQIDDVLMIGINF